MHAQIVTNPQNFIVDFIVELVFRTIWFRCWCGLRYDQFPLLDIRYDESLGNSSSTLYRYLERGDYSILFQKLLFARLKLRCNMAAQRLFKLINVGTHRLKRRFDVI